MKGQLKTCSRVSDILQNYVSLWDFSFVVSNQVVYVDYLCVAKINSLRIICVLQKSILWGLFVLILKTHFFEDKKNISSRKKNVLILKAHFYEDYLCAAKMS